MRERELKQHLAFCAGAEWLSLPMRERELKRSVRGKPRRNRYPVAPHAGARIETGIERRQVAGKLVAPHAGARIETDRCQSSLARPKVAPHAGARIETAG